MSRTITCPGCKYKKEAPDGGRVGDVIKATGYYPIPTHEGGFCYLCPHCYEVVHEHAQAIHKIIGDDYLYFPALLKLRSEDD